MRKAIFAIAAISVLAAGVVGLNSPYMNPNSQENRGYSEFFDGFCQSDAAFMNCSRAAVRLDSGEAGKITGWVLGDGVERIHVRLDNGRYLDLPRSGFHMLRQVVAEVAPAQLGGDLQLRTYVGG